MAVFSEEALKEAVNHTLNTAFDLPADSNGAFVVAVRSDGIHSAVAARINGVWQIQGAMAFHPVTHGLDYGVSVKATWK
jgi:hypothetical protein